MRKLWKHVEPMPSTDKRQTYISQFSASTAKEHVIATYKLDDEDNNTKPYAGKTAPRVYLYPTGNNLRAESMAWLEELRTRTKIEADTKERVPDHPTTEQFSFIKAMVDRCLVEQEFERTE